MLALRELQPERALAACANYEYAHAVLRDAVVCSIDEMRRNGIAKGLHRGFPSRVKLPRKKLRNVFDEPCILTVKLSA
jgi:hypothetical protein